MSEKRESLDFRAIDQQFLLINNPDPKSRQLIKRVGYLFDQDDNAFLVYGYIDSQAGVTFEVLSAARVFDDGSVVLEPGDESLSCKLRYGSFRGEVVQFTEVDKLPVSFVKRSKSIRKIYRANEDVLKARSFAVLDPLRAPGFPDDLLVLFVKKGYQNEGIWCRTVGITYGEQGGLKNFKGQMLNEPNALFGVHAGDVVDIGFVRIGNGEIKAVAIL